MTRRYTRVLVLVWSLTASGTRTAQLFMQAEAEARLLDAAGWEENLTEAIDCYLLAIEVGACHRVRQNDGGGGARKVDITRTGKEDGVVQVEE